MKEYDKNKKSSCLKYWDVCNLYGCAMLQNLDKNEQVIHIRSLKQALSHGLILKKVDRLIKFNQKAQLKPYIDMTTKPRQKTKINFDKKLMNNAIFGKAIEIVGKYGNIKLITTERRSNYLES